MNGEVAKLRIIASSIIAVLVVALGAWLLSSSKEVPWVFWMLSVLSVASVAGAEVVSSVAALWGQKVNGKTWPPQQ